MSIPNDDTLPRMKEKLVTQYNGIRDTIIQNIGTIEMLVKQAQSLGEIAKSITEKDGDGTKKELEESVAKINKAISELISQTQALFRMYEKFADEVFSQ